MQHNMARTKQTARKPIRISPRTRKRPQPHPLGPKKDDEFWYEDGTIILIAQNVEFRVYRGPLAQHSQVFRNMLSFPQPPSTPGPSQASPSPLPSGSDTGMSPACPTVHLTDSPADLRHFLRVLVLGGAILECVHLLLPLLATIHFRHRLNSPVQPASGPRFPYGTHSE